jgi:hypothetical protein
LFLLLAGPRCVEIVAGCLDLDLLAILAGEIE